MIEEVKIGIYKHYKGKEYRVLYTAVDTETKEEMVIYKDAHNEDKVWARPKKMFLEEVEVEGQKKARFEFISKEDGDDYENLYKRALADYQNLLKQTAKEKMEFAVYANENMLREILPVYDNLKLAIKHHGDGQEDEWLKGIEHVVKQFRNVLEKIGVEEIEVKDKKFDHNLMEALQSEETEDKKLDGQVAQKIKAGYKLNGKVIEPAKVVVYKLK